MCHDAPVTSPTLPSPVAPARILDLRGERCPYTFIKARLAIEELRAGEILEVLLDFPPAFERVPASMAVLGHVTTEREPGSCGTSRLRIRRGEAG